MKTKILTDFQTWVNLILIDSRYFYCFHDVHGVNLWEIKTNVFVEFHHLTEAATRVALQKKVLLKLCNILRKTPVFESLCRPSGLQFYLKETPTFMLFCEYYETFKDTYFEEYLRTAASYFMQKKNFSSKKFLNQWKSKGFQFWRLTFLQRKI